MEQSFLENSNSGTRNKHGANISVCNKEEEKIMKWTPGGESQDVEDRRDDSSGGGGGFQFGGMHVGIGGAILLLILSFVFRTNFFALLGGGSGGPAPAAVSRPSPARDEAEKPLVQFVSFV